MKVDEHRFDKIQRFYRYVRKAAAAKTTTLRIIPCTFFVWCLGGLDLKWSHRSGECLAWLTSSSSRHPQQGASPPSERVSEQVKKNERRVVKRLQVRGAWFCFSTSSLSLLTTTVVVVVVSVVSFRLFRMLEELETHKQQPRRSSSNEPYAQVSSTTSQANLILTPLYHKMQFPVRAIYRGVGKKPSRSSDILFSLYAPWDNPSKLYSATQRCRWNLFFSRETQPSSLVTSRCFFIFVIYFPRVSHYSDYRTTWTVLCSLFRLHCNQNLFFRGHFTSRCLSMRQDRGKEERLLLSLGGKSTVVSPLKYEKALLLETGSSNVLLRHLRQKRAKSLLDNTNLFTRFSPSSYG